VLLELVFEALIAAAEALDLPALGGALGSPELRGELPQRSNIASSAPLDDVARVQALAPEKRSLGPGIGRLLVLIEMASLYEALKCRLAGLAAGSSSGTVPSWARAIKDAVVMVMV